MPKRELKVSNMRFAAEQTFSRSASKPNSTLRLFLQRLEYIHKPFLLLKNLGQDRYIFKKNQKYRRDFSLLIHKENAGIFMNSLIYHLFSTVIPAKAGIQAKQEFLNRISIPSDKREAITERYNRMDT